jgi:hypothetical protein
MTRVKNCVKECRFDSFDIQCHFTTVLVILSGNHIHQCFQLLKGRRGVYDVGVVLRKRVLATAAVG